MHPNFLLLGNHSTVSPPIPLPAPPPDGHAHHHPHSLYWGKEAHFLFSGWPEDHTGMYALAIILVFLLAIVVEFLSDLDLVKPGSHQAAAVFFQAGFHATRAGLWYMMILAVMSYNGGVFIAATLGHAVGYAIFVSGLSEKDTKPNRCI